MSLVSLLRSWLRRRDRGRRNKYRPPARPRPWVEGLEERTLLDTGLGSLPALGVGVGAGVGTPGVTDPGAGGGGGGGVADPALSAYVNRLYYDLLRRAPAADELAHWSAQLAAGAGRGPVALAFTQSPE